MGNNVLAVLTRFGEQPKVVRGILERIAGGSPEGRDQALAELFIVAELRKLSGNVKREVEKMPILLDIMDNEVLGPVLRKGLRQGRLEGRVEGQVEILLSLIQKRFGRIPPAVAQRIAALKPAKLKRVGLRLLDAQRIEDLFAR
jgi:predicted transposase YdaD